MQILFASRSAQGSPPHTHLFPHPTLSHNPTEAKPPPSKVSLYLQVYPAAVSETRTPADAVCPLYIIAVVALQAFVVVAGLPFVAVLVELSSAHFTAATGVQD